MSLVIGLLLPPRIPALLLLMCAGTQSERERASQRAMACAPPRTPPTHLVLPFLTQPINLSLHPSFLHQLIGANAAPSLPCLFSLVPPQTVSMLYATFSPCSFSNINRPPPSPHHLPLGRYLLCAHTQRAYLLYVRCFMHYAEYVHPNKQFAEFPAHHFCAVILCVATAA